MRIARLPQLIEYTGMSKDTLRLAELKRGFPKRFKLGANMSAWDLDEVDEWLKQRKAARTADAAPAAPATATA